jgi:Abnormal spindle-like microcephaly-assoc'd, ASPM-SPD-2-Hydin
VGSSTENHAVGKTYVFRFRLLGTVVIALAALVLSGCAGVSSASKTTQQSASSVLTVSPTTISFGNVAVGGNSSQKGTLTATGADITVSTASWNGDGYSVSGITFPVTIAAGQSTSYTVTFTPQTAGAAAGSITFDSSASDSPTVETLSGTGTSQTSSHTVGLSWNASTSSVMGYNVYRGSQSGGPYTKLNSSTLSGTSYSDSSVQSGTTYYYVATAVDSSNVESGYSNQATATIPSQ